MSDKDHFILLKEGNVQAFEIVFKSLYQPLCGYAASFLNDMDESEEIVQQLFLNIWEKRAGIAIDTSLKSYLYRAVKNECLNKIKHLKVRKAYATEMENSADLHHASHETLESKELEMEIAAAVESLPPQCQVIFRMSRGDGKKYQDIANDLGLSIKTVENQLGKALRLLRTRLAEFLPLVVFCITSLIKHGFGK